MGWPLTENIGVVEQNVDGVLVVVCDGIPASTLVHLVPHELRFRPTYGKTTSS